MNLWQPTPALARALLVSSVGFALAVILGDAVLVVLVAPIALCAGFGLVHAPSTRPSAVNRVGHRVLHEGQGTVSRLDLSDDSEVDYVVRVVGAVPHLGLKPYRGVVSASYDGDAAPLDVAISPRRWGKRLVAEERVALYTRWAGFRWGPTTLTGQELVALPRTAPFDSRAEMPAPDGLVGAYRSARVGTGTEFAGIRPFQVGDRLRRINWRVSLRGRDLHVVDTRAEEDSAVLIAVDAFADYGRSGGIDGAESCLDRAVRAAAALAEHHAHVGDRVGLQVVGGSAQRLGLGAGTRHLRQVLGTLAQVRTGAPRESGRAVGDLTIPLKVGAGTTVIWLTAMLTESVAATTVSLMRRGIPVLVVDTLPADVTPETSEGFPPDRAMVAWRMLLLERRLLLEQLAAAGCPVVAWRGPGSLDEVLRRLARRASLPQVVSR